MRTKELILEQIWTSKILSLESLDTQEGVGVMHTDDSASPILPTSSEH